MKTLILSIAIFLLFYFLVGIVVFKVIDNKEQELWKWFIGKTVDISRLHLRICQFITLLFWPVCAVLFIIKLIKDEKRNSSKNP